jgi:hypothetical protein
MDTLFHFIFPIIAALAARLNIRHQIKTILSLAFLTVLLDLDHLMPGLERALLHNIFIVFLIPLALLLLSFEFKTDRYKKGFLFLLIMFLSSHTIIDMFSNMDYTSGVGIRTGDGVALFYPLDNTRYYVDFNISVPSLSVLPYTTDGYLASSLGVGILLYFIFIVLPCLFMDDILESAEQSHKKLRKQAATFFRNIFKG